jgi:hypothetical protein
MADSALNRLEAEAPSPTSVPGDLPDRLRRRYLHEARAGGTRAYYRDATSTAELFRDEGRRLSTTRNDPHLVADLVAIAVHRGWQTVEVRGTTDFRREAWRAARLAGLTVEGYRPTERDEQDLERRQARQRPDRSVAKPPPDRAPPTAQDRLRVVEAVVRNRIVEPAEQARVLAAARSRLAGWLERPLARQASSSGDRSHAR